MATSTSSYEDRELALVEKVEFKFALADNDGKLQSLLGVYLAPLLLKLGSEYVKVRNKVVTICQHVKARVKPASIQLPCTALIKQFQSNSESRLIRHYDLLFIQEGLPRLPRQDRAKLLPDFTAGISNLSSSSNSEASIFFHLFLQSLSDYTFPPKDSPEDVDMRQTLALSEADAAYLSNWVGKLFQFRSEAAQSPSIGLTKEEQDFLAVHGKEGAWNVSSLANAKYAAVKFICGGAFTHLERLIPTLLASADSNARISASAEDALKRTLPEVDTNDRAIVERLFRLYFRGDPNVDIAVSVPLRTRILNVLSKTTTSSVFTTEIRLIATRDLLSQAVEYGREAHKLRSAIVQFLMMVASEASESQLADISNDVLSSLKEFLDQQYDNTSSAELADLRGRGFEVIGLLLGAHGQGLLEPELRLLRWLFQRLSEERDKDVVLSISGALSSCIRPLQSTPSPETIENLRNMLLELPATESVNAAASVHNILRFANRCLPISDVSARWTNLYVLGTNKFQSFEIREEAQKGLDPYWLALGQNKHSQAVLPDFPSMALYIFEQHRDAVKGRDLAKTVVKFLRQCLFCWCVAQADQRLEFTIDWQNKIDVGLRQDLNFRRSINKSLQKHSGGSVPELIMQLFAMCCHGISSESTNEKIYASMILELSSVCPESITAHMAASFVVLLPGTLANDFETRLESARAFAALASLEMNQEASLSHPLKQLTNILNTHKTAVGADLNRAHGAMVALSHFASARFYRDPDSKLVAEVAETVLRHASLFLESQTNGLLRDGAFRALSQLCMFSVVDLEQLNEIRPFDDWTSCAMKDAKESNEVAILFLGHMSMILDEKIRQEHISMLQEGLRKLHELRQPEAQLAVGEALTLVACGWQSTAMQSNLPVDGPQPKAVIHEKTLRKIVDGVLEDCKSSKPAFKKAAVIWLLCVIQFCGEQNDVQDRLRALQTAFKRCLSDRDELVQESASRGLGLVYERGNRELKDELIRDLVSSFSSNKADMSGTVNEDTQLFEPGALPTGDGSVSTYKDVMSLASEVGDPSLVYRFMSLASNNAIWSNRAAFGRFGLSNVLSDSSVDGYLANNPKMYSALYRYRFDPNNNVRRSMNDIWNALVKDPVLTVNQHFRLIVTDLLKSMTGREWRTRQASCAALADLLQGRRLALIHEYLDEAWSKCFKVLDDIKETVRTEAAGLARVLTNILVNNLESSEGKADIISDLLKSVIPFLLSPSGIESSADDVKLFSLGTLTKIVKKSRPTLLRPFLPDLISQLLILLTSFEPDAVNYIALNAQNYDLTQSDIDDARLKVIRSSPIMEAVERALDMLDEETMTMTLPKLLETMRAAAGVPSKVGCSRVIVSLSTRRNAVFRPFADQMLMALERRVLDRNETVSSSYAASFGYVSRIASDAQILKSAAFIQTTYFGDADDDRPRFIAAEMIHAIAKSATDRFNALASDLIPLAYFGQFDDTERVRQVFKDTYDEIASGPRVVSLYLKEVLDLARKHLSSSKWVLKHASAKVLAGAVRGLVKSHGSISVTQASLIWPLLEEALSQKTWEGKADVLEGLVIFTQSTDRSWRSSRESDIRKIALREARRRNKEYQKAALDCLGKIAAALVHEDMLNDVSDIATAIIRETSDAMDVDGEDPQSGGTTDVLVVANAVVATFEALHLDEAAEAQDLLARAEVSLDCAQSALALPPTTARNSQLAVVVFTSLKRLCEALRRHSVSEQVSILDSSQQQILSSPAFLERSRKLFTTAPEPMQEKSRTSRAEALVALVELLRQGSNDLVPRSTSLPFILDSLLANEKSIPVRNILLSAQRRLTNSASE